MGNILIEEPSNVGTASTITTLPDSVKFPGAVIGDPNDCSIDKKSIPLIDWSEIIDLDYESLYRPNPIKILKNKEDK